MEPIKVSVDVTVDFSESAKAFVAALFGSHVPTGHSKTAPVESIPVKPAEVEKPTTAEPVPAKPADVEHEQAKPVAPSVTIEDVRKVLSEKVNAHRPKIKEKLDSLNAPSVTKLDSSKYQEMYDFLMSLE